MEYRERIPSNPNVMLGKPCIKGTRITVELLLDLLAQRVSIREITEEMYPHIVREDVLAAIRNALDVLTHEEVLLEQE